ncbi:MAG: hypothetical protein AAF961_03430 [Planctomycetota bacterium]
MPAPRSFNASRIKLAPGRVVMYSWAIALASTIASPIVVGEQPIRRDSQITPASATLPIRLPDISLEESNLELGDSIGGQATRVRFAQRPTRVGDRVDQSLEVDVEVETQIVQSGQTAHQGVTRKLRRQKRRVVVLETADGRLRKARVSFPLSRLESSSPEEPGEPTVQPIEGKQYLIERDGDQLRVTDPSGVIPPMDQFQLVVDSLHSVGKPNPLAKILVGREIAVGQRLLVPREVASEMLGLGSQMGAVQRFELKLLRASPKLDHERQIATFLAKIDTVPEESSQMTMSITGKLSVDAATCRTLSVEFSGPVGMSVVERTPLGIYQYSASGGVRVAILSSYSDLFRK